MKIHLKLPLTAVLLLWLWLLLYVVTVTECKPENKKSELRFTIIKLSVDNVDEVLS